MSLDRKCVECCEELIRALPVERRKRFDSLLTYKQHHYVDPLHEGLTYLAISCCELGVLFSKFEKEASYDIVLQRMTIGYLFEVYNSIWEWIGKPIKTLCKEKAIPVEDFESCRKALDVKFARYAPLVKAIRNGTFHTKDTGDKDWVDLAARLAFLQRIPQALRWHLYEYGYNVNVVKFNKGIYGCYPGIGGFGAIHPAGRVLPMKDLYLAGTAIRITPEQME